MVCGAIFFTDFEVHQNFFPCFMVRKLKKFGKHGDMRGWLVGPRRETFLVLIVTLRLLWGTFGVSWGYFLLENWD
jgi:hypothetical protein